MPARLSRILPPTMGSRRKRSRMRSRSSEPLPDATFFIDRDLGRRFPEMLRAHGLRVEIHDDHFPQEQKPADHVWIEMTASRGWVAVTHDASIRHTSRSREAVIESGARLPYGV